ncbi:MAG: 3'-5' exoribonuclease YhaM family protein [Bacillota bacterium]
MEIKEITGNTPVTGEYLILENQLRTAKNGSTYLAMKIGDQTGELAVKIWDADLELFQLLEVGKVIELKNLTPKLFKGQIQLEWEGKQTDAFRLLPAAEIDYSKFLPRSPGNLTEYWDFLRKQVNTIENAYLKRILLSFFDDQEFVTRFTMVPAALKRHHAYIGGLLEHTAGVTAICQAAAAYYQMVNRDLLITGAILHDVGKVKTYKLERNIEGTDEGKLIGHLILGVRMVEEVMAKTPGGADKENKEFQQLKNSLLHLLVSHHGIMEWGSPVEPLTVEACILHHADNMDAQVQKFLTVIRGQNSNDEWSPYDPGLGKSIFMGNLNRRDLEDHISEGA